MITDGTIEHEMSFLHENYTYNLVPLPKGRKALKNKWVYKLNIDKIPHNHNKRCVWS